MANGRIESQEELQSYLASTPARERLTPGEIAAIVGSAVFDRGRFRGMFLGALSTKYSGEDIGALRAALGDPPSFPIVIPAVMDVASGRIAGVPTIDRPSELQRRHRY